MVHFLTQRKRGFTMAEFMIGCNYWDSASGTDMWRNWDESVVEKDLAALEQCGVKYLRVFPNWRDFQPVAKLYSCQGGFGEYVNANDESDLDHNVSGVSDEMIAHFRRFAEIADAHSMKLNVGVLTGWMSGRLFKPQTLDGKNAITDSEALMWTHRFINAFVSAVQDIDNIVLWDLGNECNNLGPVKCRSDAYAWTAFVRNAIRQADSRKRPIASGMHGLSANAHANWTIADQGEICDMMTTHPYPSPTIKNNIEPYNGLRGTIFPTAQSMYYSGLGNRPCMIQEQGTFSPTNGNREMSAQFLRVNVLSAWANDLTGYFWWCGTEHIKLNQPPYSWIIMERQLGMLDVNGQPKPVGREMAKMQKVLSALPPLPVKQIDAICVLPHEGDPQLKAMSTFVLAQEAGFNIGIRNTNTPIPESNTYIVPCIEGWNVMGKRTLDFLLDRVMNHGAKCLFTYQGGDFIDIENLFGFTSNGIRRTGKKHIAKFPFGDIEYIADREMYLESVGAEVLVTNEEGNIVLSRNRLGKGYVYFLAFPLEMQACNETDGFNPELTQPYYEIYRMFAKEVCDSYVVQTQSPYIGITQHKNEDGSFYVTAINYTEKDRNPELVCKAGWQCEVLYGNMECISACDGLVMLVKQQ